MELPRGVILLDDVTASLIGEKLRASRAEEVVSTS